MLEATLYEHEDGRYAVAPGQESPDFTHNEPAWHRVGPVDVSALATPAAAEGGGAVEEEGMPGILKAMKWSYDCFYVKGQNNRDERETYISNLEDDLPKLFIEVDDLVALVNRLARSLRKAAPDNDLADKAVDYLRRKGLQSSPLRATPAAAAPRQDALTGYCDRNGGCVCGGDLPRIREGCSNWVKVGIGGEDGKEPSNV